MDPQNMIAEEQLSATRLCWMAVHGNLCLALRHPGNRGPSRRIIVEFVKRLGRSLVEWGVLTEEQLKYTERIEAEAGSEDLTKGCPRCGQFVKVTSWYVHQEEHRVEGCRREGSIEW